jgi:predicted PurR-regulated permease PerM
LGIAVWGLGNALTPLLISFGLAYLIFPLVKKMETKGIRRNHAVLSVFSLFSIILIAGLVLVVPRIVSDAGDFANELPEITSRAIDKVDKVASKLGYELDLSKEGLLKLVDTYSSSLSANVAKNVAEGVGQVFSGVAGWLISILNLFLVPLFFFYVINDFEKISTEIGSYIPKSARPRLSRYLTLSNTVLSGYIRGQLMVALILGCLYAIGLSFLGLKFGAVVGLVTGLVSIIPYAGFTLGFLTAVLIALANFSGFELIIGIVILFTAVQILESIFITPKLVGDKVGLSSLATMLGLIIGGNLLGVTGMLMAIPVAAITKLIFVDLKKEYQQLDFYT